MQTHFSLRALAEPGAANCEKILRACVHCGFCTATCPTYLVTGDELDSPRGRIYLIKEMLENERPADARTARHIDRCLSCLSCMTTCPSGVHYMHLADHARAHIEKTFARPLGDRLLRGLLAYILPRPKLLRASVQAARLAKPFAGLLPARLRGLLAMAPKHLPAPSIIDRPQTLRAQGASLGGPDAPMDREPPGSPSRNDRSHPAKLRVALLNGCAQTVLDTRINEATVRLLTRHGVEVVVAEGAGCCGALPHHLGKLEQSHEFARRNIEAWTREIETGGLDHIVINTSGCGTSVKDYGFMFRGDPALAQKAAHVSSIARDVSEIAGAIGFAPLGETPRLRVAYHSACSLQHGQKITREPAALLERAGFDVLTPTESHICCGSAGTYNLLQPDLANELGARKAANIEALAPDVIAAGNLGCMIQIGARSRLPVVHTVELLDWASGGPQPAGLSGA